MLGALLPAFVVFLQLPQVELTEVSGNYDVTDARTDGSVVQYLTKFGVKAGNTVYLSGSLSRPNNFSTPAICAFVPETIWEVIYRNGTKTCDSLASLLTANAYLNNNTRSCIDELQQNCFFKNVGVEYNFSAPLTNQYQTMYWYLVLISCHISNSSLAASNGTEFSYSIKILNDRATGPFIYQFSYEYIGIVVMTMCSTGATGILLLFHVVVHAPSVFKRWKTPGPANRMHPLVKMYTLSLFLLLDGQVFQLIHWLVFSSNGVGVPALDHLGVAIGGLSTWILVLVFILISKGWQMTTRLIPRALFTLLVWGLYIVFSVILFVWTVVLQEVFPYMTWPDHPYKSWVGWVFQSYRILLFIYLLYELWHSYQQENNPLVLNIYRLFAVGFVVWFGYLPITVGALYAANTLEWTRVILSASLFFDLAANFILVILFCPLWSDYYFQFNSHLNVIGSRTRYTSLVLSEKNDSL